MKRTLDKSTRWLWVIPIFLALLFNLNVLQNGLGWDDENIIPNLRPPDHWRSLFLPDPTASKQASSYYRPLVALSYHLDHLLWGDQPFGFHLSVYLAHILNTALVFFLAQSLIRVTKTAPQRLSPDTAPLMPSGLLPLISASLFAVHPVHAEAVAWIAGRNDVFCTSFLLASLLLYLRFDRTGRRRFFILSMLAFFFALLTKEIAVGLLFLFPLYECLATLPVARPAWPRIGARLLIPLAILGMYFWMRAANITAPYGPSTPTDSSAWDSLGKILSAYGLYLKLMAFPYPHSPFIATLPTSPLFLMASALIVAALGGGFLFAVVRRHRIVGMGLGWTLVLLAPAGAVAIQPLAAAVAAERYVYAPSVGFVIVEAWVILNGLQLIQAAPRRLQRQWTVAAVLLVIVVISAWGWESWKRNAVWRTPVTFWEAAVLVSPETGFPHGQLGLQYARLGRQDDAEKELLFAIKQMNSITDQATALSNLGNLYSTEGRYQDAVRVLKTALDQDPTNDEIYWHMAELFFAMSARKDETTADGKRVTDYDPALFADGENYLKRALELRPMLQLYFEAGTIYMSFGKLAEAEAYFQKILDANPNPKTQLAIRTKQRLAHLKSGSR